MKQKIKRLTSEIQAYIATHLSTERYEHSVSVAKYAKHLALVYGKSVKKQRLAYLAGLAHDICKELSDSEQLLLLQKAQLSVSPIEKQRINLAHGKTGAFFLEHTFCIDSSRVLAAVRHHTFGSPDLDTVGKLVFLADKIEPHRKFADKWRKRVGRIPLNELVLQVLQENIKHVQAKGFLVSDETIRMEKKLQKKISKKQKALI